MSNRSTAAAHERPGAVRPLPTRPSLEFERKRAKKVLRELRQSDPGARLTDAQFRIAREYGFLSWPRLVGYFETLARHERSGPAGPGWGYPVDHFESWAKTILAEHRDRRAWTAGLLGTFVPRFHGRSQAEIFAAELTLDEARLVVAREYLCPSWDALLERASAERDTEGNRWSTFESPFRKAFEAIRANDLDALRVLVDAHPELVAPTPPNEHPRSALHSALAHEAETRSADARRITDWLATRGDLPRALGEMLLQAAHNHRRPDARLSPVEHLRFLLDRGADLNWLPPNGIPALEHALVVQGVFARGDRSVVDFIAQRVRPRKALWIAAGLGDVRGVARFFGRDGALTKAAWRNRPDLTAIMRHGTGGAPDAPAHDVMFEAFLVAVLNRRFEACDVLLDRGLPVDYAPGGSPMLNTAVSSQLVDVVEYLVGRGANVDVKGWRPHATARELAQYHFAGNPDQPDARRILALCGGGDPDEVLRAYKAQAVAPPTIADHLAACIALGREEAARLGQTATEPHNILVGMLRDARVFPLALLTAAGGSAPALREQLAARLVPPAPAPANAPPLSAAATALLDATLALAREKRHRYATTPGMLFQMVASGDAEIARMIEATGASMARMREVMAGV